MLFEFQSNLLGIQLIDLVFLSCFLSMAKSSIRWGEILRVGAEFVERSFSAVERVDGISSDESSGSFGLSGFRDIAALFLAMH